MSRRRGLYCIGAFMSAVVKAVRRSDEPLRGDGAAIDGQLTGVPEYEVTEDRRYTKFELVERALGLFMARMGRRTRRVLQALFGGIGSPGVTYHEAIIRYQSIDHQGDPIMLSGSVTYKSVAGAPWVARRIIVDSHATITDSASCPSQGGSMSQLLALEPTTMVVSADYQGYGVSRDALHPYLNADVAARQQVDLVKAAIHYLSAADRGVAFSARPTTRCLGYSQGGAVALATQRYIEQHEGALAERLGLGGSVCGDGPYDLVRSLGAYLRQGHISVPVILPMMVRGMMESYPELFEGMSMTDYFTDGFLGAGGGLLAMIDAKEMNVVEYNKVLGAKNPLATQFPLDSIIRREALHADSAQMGAIMAAFERNNCLRGWTPRHPVTFYHSEDDTIVPYDNLAEAGLWPSEVYRIVTPSKRGIDHLAGAFLFYADIFKGRLG